MLKEAIINLLDLTGGLAIAKHLTRRRPGILMYHRIVKNSLLPGISPELFEAQLVYIKKHFTIISLNDLLANIHEAPKPFQLAITFDDGHHDFYTDAWPILRKHQIPATLFVTTGFIDKKIWLWPDLIRSIVINAKPAVYFSEEIGRIDLTINDPIVAWSQLANYCLRLPYSKREMFIKNLAAKMDVPINPEPQEPFAPTSWNELREMHSQGLDVGSHSVTHPILSELPDQELLHELKEAKRRILEEIGVEPRGICYPNGMAKDTSPKVENYARQFYQYGLVAYPAEVSTRNLMHLGRFAASSNLPRFKLLINGLSPHINHAGEYR
jgi:peptidoglycan/xylan/chitin deacetylase (PgdA/CDA1 family)